MSSKSHFNCRKLIMLLHSIILGMAILTLGSGKYNVHASYSSQATVELPILSLPYGYDPDLPQTYELVKWSGGPHEYGKLETQATYSQGLGSGLDFSSPYTLEFCNLECSFIVRAMAEGTVIFIGEGSFGKQVAIKHDFGGSVIIYGHLYDYFPGLEEGSHVIAGSAIGHAGHTHANGIPDVPIHLHVELRDGVDTCTSYCLGKPGTRDYGLGGNPLGWHGVRIGDYTIFEYRESSSSSARSYNYDGVAVRGFKVKGYDGGLKYPDVDYYNDPPHQPNYPKIYTWLPYNFQCESNTTDCEENNNFKRDLGDGYYRYSIDVVFAGHGQFGGGGILSSGPTGLNDEAQFISDISIPDGTIVFPGQLLTKTWRMQNTGTSPWGNESIGNSTVA